jgi:hypothetical protein
MIGRCTRHQRTQVNTGQTNHASSVAMISQPGGIQPPGGAHHPKRGPKSNVTLTAASMQYSTAIRTVNRRNTGTRHSEDMNIDPECVMSNDSPST